jgi:hypothetical protein
MSGVGQSIKTVRDVGYQVIMKNEDGTPRQVLWCFIKEGQYGKFISIEQHWVRRMEGKKIVESDWARKTYSFPYDKARAFEKWNAVMELLKDALAPSGGKNLEREVEEEFGAELEGLNEEF